jgi:hypothetical protein
MRTPPDTPEFARFTEAMRTIMSVSKDELKKREKAEKRKPMAPASPSSVVPTTER